MANNPRRFLERSEAYYNERVDKEIERNRKGDFELVFLNKDGRLITEDIDVKVDLKRIDFNFGANIFMLGEYDTEEENKRYEEKFLNLFNTATIPLYWEGTEPEEGYLRYDENTPHDVYRRPPADYVKKFCMENGLEMKGHPLFWHEFVPAWLPNNYDVLKKYIVKRFKEISERYSDDVERFDVVNEPSRIYDCYMRDKYWKNKSLVPEDDYCVWLFRLARDLFPTNKLIINDTSGASFAEFRGKYSGYYLNIKDLLSRGVEIDEIGLQCHLGWGDENENAYDTERLYDVLDTYAALGKTINISEISISSEWGEDKDLEFQAEAAERLYKTAFSHPAVTGLTWWNLPDDGILTTKRVANNENLPSAGLLDRDYNEKPAYKRLRHLIKEEWTTNEKTSTNTGVAGFRGYYGIYTVTAKVDGKEVSFEADFRQNSQRIHKIML